MPKFNDCQCINCQYTKVHGGYMPCVQINDDFNPEPPQGTLSHDVNQLNKAWCEFKLQLKLQFLNDIARIKKWWRK